MNLLGQAVNHKIFGMGVITDRCDNKITVHFAKNKKIFLFPDAVPRYLTLKNTAIQKKIERINEEWEQKINEKKRKAAEENQYRSRLYTMKIPPKSQMAYNLSEEALEGLKYVDTGCFLSGLNKGKPRVPANIQPNSAIVLTDCTPGNEDERMIIGVSMVDERFWGDTCTDGKVKLHKTYQLILPHEHRIPFWKYFKQNVIQNPWGSVPFKYVQNQVMEKILFDICQNTAETVQAAAALEIYRYFCQLNRLPEKLKIHKGIEKSNVL